MAWTRVFGRVGGRGLADYLQRMMGDGGVPPWFRFPPTSQAQAEVRALLGEEQYRRLVNDRRITLEGSSGGRYTLWAARALRGADTFFPRVFDEQREAPLCVALDPSGRGQRAWEDEWNGLIRWIRCAEPQFVRVANPLRPRPRRRGTQEAGNAQGAR